MSVEGLDDTLRDLDANRDAILGRVRQAIKMLSVRLQARVKAEKLTGQVLNVRTGRLRRSISYAVNDAGDQIVGEVGTNVEYARRLEFGFTGDEKVREHMRTAKMAWGKMIKNPKATVVRGHTRKIKLDPHSFLNSALAEMQPKIQADLAAAMEDRNGAGA